MQKGVVRKRRTSPLSEYGRQLQQKQELKREYNLRERQFGRYVKEVLQKAGNGNSAELLMRQLEKRLDSVVFRMGIATTRKQARQFVSHGHIFVNGRPMDIPSYIVKTGEKISVRPTLQKKPAFQNILIVLKKYQAPSWLHLDKEKVEATVQGEPSFHEIAPTVELPLVFEFYSR
ncbi:MAG: hypothetical protein A3E07_01360 [Candidatus Wildermuthbacteria bacterium RIFCSPHIGHO2_12_FULL_45_9]|uniref:Small ribosomal subunit protein uS4 n=1 Tax=Candidatus Wildermuthbacteria bacterium RIFCSPHIGHO2_02_FULL_45_25 TaxID=1802450 RepID=A0A1G2QYS8_9BACT|nr:MAG: hypothetical protein A2748_02740 [Candidatus Wildermuthbacteria bacterium RIFCSPHIGHO2_01_FULL_45_20]OHA65279.1 MAG: hypothetical protein A3C04_03165 [Candidatus Wildermuthbacteria bacterium RIFCSPHIGHO2_02_FULL_45_25]OHA70617.1 MAG: hypothetical protein A3E07_01360 [Candidatus Wildermuthbacteria bacterium RIFCSPHIGHO2_12_FULL_45_9]